MQDTSTHYIIRSCPLCRKPTGERPDNLWKLYVRRHDGAYFCHRCGAGGSWYDFKAAMGDVPVIAKAGRGGDGAVVEAGDAAAAAFVGRESGDAFGIGGNGAVAGANRLLPLRSAGAAQGKAYSSNRAPTEAGAAHQEALTVDLATVQSCRDALLSAAPGSPPDRVLQYLTQTRKLSIDVLHEYAVGYMRRRFPVDATRSEGGALSASTLQEHECIVFPWISLRSKVAGTIPTNLSPEHHICHRMKIRSVTDKSKQLLLPRGGSWGMFGMHTVPPSATSVVITEGELDAMSVRQDTGLHAISLPNGCRSMPLELLPWLERFERIYLWMDDDIAGREGAERISSKLGLGRCHLVRPSATLLLPAAGGSDGGVAGSAAAARVPKDANEMLQRGLQLKPVVDAAVVQPHDQIASFADLRSAVMREIAAVVGVPADDAAVGASLTSRRPPAGVPIRSLPRLHRIVKGHRAGEVTIVTGPTGCGKTTLLSQISLDLATQGVRTLWGSFEIKNTRLIATMLHQLRGGRIVSAVHGGMAGSDVSVASDEPALAGSEVPTPSSRSEDAASAAMREFDAAADVLSNIPLHFLRFYGSTDVDKVIDALEYASYVYDVEHVILDNLQFMMSSAGRGMDKFDAQEKALDRFRAFATRHDVHLTLVIHPRKEPEDAPLSMSSVFGSAKATQEADTVMIVQRGADGRKYVEVKKNRYDGTLGSVPVSFDTGSRCFLEDDGVGGAGANLLGPRGFKPPASGGGAPASSSTGQMRNSFFSQAPGQGFARMSTRSMHTNASSGTSSPFPMIAATALPPNLRTLQAQTGATWAAGRHEVQVGAESDVVHPPAPRRPMSPTTAYFVRRALWRQRRPLRNIQMSAEMWSRVAAEVNDALLRMPRTHAIVAMPALHATGTSDAASGVASTAADQS